MLYVCGDLDSWVRVTHEIHEDWSHTKNDNSTVPVYDWNFTSMIMKSEILCTVISEKTYGGQILIKNTWD